MTFTITLSNSRTEDVEATYVQETGHEGRWLEFSDDEGVVLQIPSKVVIRVQRT